MKSHRLIPARLTAIPSWEGLFVLRVRKTKEAALVRAYHFLRYYIQVSFQPQDSTVDENTRKILRVEYDRLNLLLYSLKYNEFVAEVEELRPKVYYAGNLKAEKYFKRMILRAEEYTAETPAKPNDSKKALRLLRLYAGCNAVNFFRDFYNSLSRNKRKKLSPDMADLLYFARSAGSMDVVNCMYEQKLIPAYDQQAFQQDVLSMLSDVLRQIIPPEMRILKVRNYCKTLLASGARLSMQFKKQLESTTYWNEKNALQAVILEVWANPMHCYDQGKSAPSV